MSTGTNVTATLWRKLQLWSAVLEAYLSTHAFELLFLIVYATAVALQFVWGAHEEFHHVRMYLEKPGQAAFKWYIAIARGAGYTLNLNCAIILILASRLFITFIRETPLHRVLPLDKSFPSAHIVVGYSILVGLVIHVPFHFVWIITFRKWDPFSLWSVSMTVATGIPLSSIFVFMFFTAIPWMRRTNFRLFYVVHILGCCFFFPLLIFHGMFRKKPETYKWVIPGIIIYAADRIARFLKISTATITISGESTTIKGGNVLELRLPKPFNYRPGQYAEIAVPLLSNEWHPFTIASSPHEHTMCFYIKANGNWTQALYEEFESRIAKDAIEQLQVRVRGPFGAPSQHINSYKRIVLISGGIGATPFTAVAKHLHHLSKPFESLNSCPGLALSRDVARESQLQYRISKIVGKLYDLSFNEKPVVEVLKQQRAKYIAETLTLASAHGHLQSKLPSEQSDTTSSCRVSVSLREASETSVDVDDLVNSSAPRYFPDLHRLRARALSVLRTTRFILVLLILLIARFALIAIIGIWRLAAFGFVKTTMAEGGRWALCTEMVLCGVLTTAMTLMLSLELSYLRTKFFWRLERCLDLLTFVPVSVLVLVLSALTWRRTVVQGAFTSAHFGLLLPLQFAQLSFRMFRAQGAQGLVDIREDPICADNQSKGVPDVDFVWTTPTGLDDQWLRDELQPLENGSSMRLHRYVTRESTSCDESATHGSSEQHISTCTGRPQWDVLFTGIAAHSRAGSKVGVFFCGPRSMGREVQRALRAVEIHSNLRGAYLASLSDQQITNDFGAECGEEMRNLRCFGNNVRFIFREENF